MAKERSEEKSRYLENVIGKETLAKIDAASENTNKSLEDLKVAYKDFANATPEKPATETSPETEKALGQVYGELATGMSELVNIVTLQAKALKAQDDKYAVLELKHETETKAWQKALDEVRTVVNMPPRRASQDDSTVRTEAEKQTIKEASLVTTDPVANFFGAKVKAN